MGTAMTTVAVIDDHPVYRRGLAQAVAASPDLMVVATFESVDAFLDAAQPADVVLLDYQLPGVAGPDAVRAIVSTGAAVLMVSANIAREAVLATLAAGARGYVAKHADVPEILEAIATVSDPNDPGTYVSPTLAAYLLDAADTKGVGKLVLSDREREVLALVAGGERDKDIAEILCISVGTVRSHLDHIRTKTGRHRRAELATYALRQGITPSPGSVDGDA